MTGMVPNRYKGRGTARQLLDFQRLAWSSMVFSLTRRCPLSCSFCITSSRPDFPGPVVSKRRAERWAAQLPVLGRAGLRHISFTGGEPIIALPAVEVLSRSGAAAGIRTAVVTSGAWATNAAQAARVVQRLRSVSHWDISYDIGHAEQMPESRFRMALEALTAAGASFSVRVCTRADNPSQTAFMTRLRQIIGPEITMITQSVRGLGRAAESTVLQKVSEVPCKPCMATGPFVREDGTVGPCCCGLAYESIGRTPFDYGNVDDIGLMAAWRRWRSDSLLRLMRLTGLAIPLQWLKEEGLARDSFCCYADVCETCVALWREMPLAAERLRNRSAESGVKRKLDELERHLYGSVWQEL